MTNLKKLLLVVLMTLTPACTRTLITLTPPTATPDHESMVTEAAATIWPTGDTLQCGQTVTLTNMPSQALAVAAEQLGANATYLGTKPDGETQFTFTVIVPPGAWSFDLVANPGTVTINGGTPMHVGEPVIGSRSYNVTC
jgi:hypothetical protein